MILVKPEGRLGVRIVTKDEAIRFVQGLEGQDIHCFIPTRTELLGADWSKEDVIVAIGKSNRLAITTGESQKGNANHALSVIKGNELFLFDVGGISDEDLTVG